MSGGFGGRAGSGSTNPVVMLGAVILIVACLGGAAYLLLNPAHQQAAEPSAAPIVSDLVDVLVPVDPIEAGTALEPELFRKESRPAQGIPPTVITDFVRIKGQYAASFVASGQPLLVEHMTSKRPASDLEPKIPEGYRAVTMSVDSTTSVEGWTRPGAKVDVVLASEINGKPAITVIVQNAEVLSTDRQLGRGGDAAIPSTVTLLVTSEEAVRIQLAASSVGQLSLSLRGDEDDQNPVGTTITIDDLLGMKPNDPQPQELPREGLVRVGESCFSMQGNEIKPVECPPINKDK